MFWLMSMKRNLIPLIVGLALNIAVFFPMFFARVGNAYAKCSDAFFVCGAVIFGYFALSLIVRAGTFDVFNYSFYRLFESFRHQGMEKRYHDAGDYKIYKMEQRRKRKVVWIPYVVLFGLDMVLAVSFLIAFFATNPSL